jgi:hypothetical protein
MATLRLDYQSVPLQGTALPHLPPGTTVRWRPLVRVRIIGSAGLYRDFDQALVDSGADDTVFPLGIEKLIQARLRAATTHTVRWRGKKYPVRFGDVELELTDDRSVWRWPAVVIFCPAPLPYPLLGHSGCLEFINATFLDVDRVVELETNPAYQGSVT